MSLRVVWLTFLWACVAALFVLVGIWTFRQAAHADQVLSWLIAFVPVILGVLVIAVPAKHEDEQTHMRWRYVLGGVLIVYGVLVWVQQTRALSEAQADQQKAITDTAAKTSAAVSAEVSKTVGAEYQNMIADLNMQIQSLQHQLSDQAKDFARQLRQTDADLNGSISKFGIPPTRYAQLEFKAFSGSSPTIIPDKDGVFSVDFIFTNTSEVGTGTGDVWVFICDECEFAGNQVGFDSPVGLIDREKHMTFPQLNPGVTMERKTIRIKITGGPFSWTDLGFRYACAECGKVNPMQLVRYSIGRGTTN